MLKFANETCDGTLEALKSGVGGLSVKEAAARLSKYGKNELKEGKRKSFIGLFIAQLGDVMTILLIAAACISALIAYLSRQSSDLIDTAIIVAIIFLNAAVGAVQQYRADRAIEGLKKLSSTVAKVRREGAVSAIDAANLTVGDIVILEEGDVVPADLRIISATSLRCDESALTGESCPVEKGCDAVRGAINYSTAANLAFSSTFVVGGSGEGVVTAVGKDTEIGGIAGMLEGVKKDFTPLEKSLNKLGKIISAFVIAVAALIFVVGVVVGKTGILKNFMTAVAIAVAAIPEGLPAVVSVIMAMGVQRMSRENVIIRKLKCVETLGGCSCICTDKTGTLTQNKMSVSSVWTAEGKRPAANSLLHACMATCTRAKEVRGGYMGDPTETAIISYARGAGFSDSYTVTGEIPFSSERKLMSVSARGKRGAFVFVKGAPEEVFKRCNMGGALLKEAQSAADNMSKEALRVLAFAYKKGASLSEDGLTFLGLAGMIDGLKEGVRSAVASCKRAGVTTVMITGDSPETAFALAQKAGIAESREQVFTGDDLDKMTKPQLKRAIAVGRVFARVSPKHKNIIVRLKKAQGEVVAMTGDGVNDAPPVKSADIGIVMGQSGTEVTKSVADMIIADDNFTTIVKAVGEGRRISSNVRKTIQFFISTNLAEVLAIMIATFAFMGYAFLPSTQLLWINLITDSFPVLALGVEKGGGDDMNHAPVRAEKALFSRQSICFMLISALYITGVIMGAYAYTLFNYGAEDAVTVAFLTMSFAELFHAFNVRSGKSSAARGLLSNKVLIITVSIGIAVNVLLCISPLGALFSLTKLNIRLWSLSFGAALSVIVFGEIYKLCARAADKIKARRTKLKRTK